MDDVKRRHPRVAVDLKVRFSILIPEQTFQPYVQDASVCDLSERGAMVCVQISKELSRALMQQTRYCRIGFGGAAGLPEKLIGKAVWIQQEKSAEETLGFRIGLFFEDMPEEASELLRSYVDTVASEKGVLPETP